MPIHAPFRGKGGKRGNISSNDVTHRPNPKKGDRWAEPRHLSHKTRKSVRAGRLNEKRQDMRTGKKVTKGLYFTYLWRSPHWSDVCENLCRGWCSRRNHVCQVSKWIFQGLQFYRGSNFPFFLLILNGPYNNSAALLRCQWLERLIALNIIQSAWRHLAKHNNFAVWLI